MPLGVKLLGRYDVWDHSDPDVLPFQYGMRSYDTHPESSIWEEVFSEYHCYTHAEQCIKNGKAILRYVQKTDRIYAESCAFETKIKFKDETMFKEIPAIAVNKGLANSKLFDGIWDVKKHPIAMTFVWRNDKWTVSLYTTEETGIDVSEIAKSFGGGGHKCAAGFQCNRLPFDPYLKPTPICI
jgi:oligoribonuclease NrnB/cAMP/cGMP phosphodiesterase (DHH superfamily)